MLFSTMVISELCDDLLDTLNCLKTISCQHEDNRVKPAIKPNQTKPERQITSTRRLASKLGRKVSLLPSHTKLLEQPAVAAMNSQTGHPSSKPSTRENQPKKCDVKDEESPFGGATKGKYGLQNRSTNDSHKIHSSVYTESLPSNLALC